jgi:hypothetical protein
MARITLIFAFSEHPQVPQFGILELGIQELLASEERAATAPQSPGGAGLE